jgi:hypothetical protein
MCRPGVWIPLLFLAVGAVAYAQQAAGKPEPYRVMPAGITGASRLLPGAGTGSKLEFQSSDAKLVEAFDWAKRQSMAYAFDNDPVGPWYEAGEPGRESFCIRDVAHQTMGGQALGLARHNQNMLRRFAENISDARDWCSLWHMTRYNVPTGGDNTNDNQFFYTLPSNFDLVDACYRMFVWTSDLSYVSDPVFLNLYDRTVNDYVQRWDLGLDKIMKRKRFMNARGDFDPKINYQFFRGHPSYDERREDFVAGMDLLATMYNGYFSYARIQRVRGNEELAQVYMKKAADVKALVNNTWWNEKEQYFYARLNGKYEFEGRSGVELLYRDIVEDGPKLKAVLSGGGRGSAEVLYKYGDPDAAYARMLDVAFGPGVRREYPEVPYTWVGALVNGTMGITMETGSPLIDEGPRRFGGTFTYSRMVKTVAGLGTKLAWAELRNLPVRANQVTVRHEGLTRTIFTNQTGPAMTWQAGFRGSHETLLVNGQPMKAVIEKGPLGRVTSSVRVIVGAGGYSTVEVPK